MKTNLPPQHQWIQTEDGSYTLFSENFQEACHSVSGAVQETLLHYVQGCQIEKKAEFINELSILEVGFGLGIGFLTTFDVLKNHIRPWNFLSLEIDEQLLEWFRLENSTHPFLKNLHWKTENDELILEAKNDQINLSILCGNARKTLPKFLENNNFQWDCIYQDAFSPKKNPILWTVEWFELLKTHAQPDALLSTYSASSSIRKSLLGAGWSLHKGEKFGPKRTSTRASLAGENDPDILLQLERSPVSALKDDNFKDLLPK